MKKELFTKAEMTGWWKHRANEFDLHKIRSVMDISVPIDAHSSINMPHVIVGGYYAQTLPVSVFRGLYELVARDKNHTLEEEFKSKMVKITWPTLCSWEEMNTAQTIEAMDFIRELWDRSVAELLKLQNDNVMHVLNNIKEKPND